MGWKEANGVGLTIGETFEVKAVFTQEDFDRFAGLSGDDNPIHVDPDFSARTRFGRTVAHGMLLYGKVCQVLGAVFPGPGTVQIEQEMIFPAPTYAEEEITLRIEVADYRAEERTAELITQIVRPDGSLGLDGTTIVRLPSGGQNEEPREA
jgi:acyl dehydratase